jgi:hypothetical protein
MPLTSLIESVCMLPETSGSYDDGYAREYILEYEVITTGEQVAQIDVMFAPGIPRVWDPFLSFANFNGDALARCRRVQPRRDMDQLTRWIVTCEYSTKASATDIGTGTGPGSAQRPPDQGGEPDPTKWAPNVWWEAEEVKVPVVEDLDGKLPQNTAGDFFSPPVEEDASIPKFICERYEAEFDSERAFKVLANSLNETVLFGWAQPDQVKLKTPTGRFEIVGGIGVWRVRYEFLVKMFFPFTWQPRPLNAGFRELRDGETVPIHNSDGQQVTVPVPLFLAGGAMNKNEIERDGVNYIDLRVYERFDHTTLNIPGLVVSP